MAESPSEGRADLGNKDVATLRMKRSVPLTRLKLGTRQIVKPKALPSMDVLSRVRLSHTDHLRRLALTKKSENLCRLAAVLDRAEPILERFEQYLLAQQCQESNQAIWVEQHQNLVEDPGRNRHPAEHCLIVDDNGESVEVQPVDIVYGSTNANGPYS
ncbi:unnamed protein product [Cylicostephanus goldi]|uniref:Uncharacterized protein n=1 Tax=Cylicostephanus goldi TaxID=71465 RepID=A0A3P7MQD0_CYLGO|nr:unnamed protein product [Cylicostephanus goldi]